MWVDNIFLSCHCKFNKMKDCCEKSCSSLAPFARNRRENLETVTSQSSHYKGNNSLSSCFKMGYNFSYLSDSPKCLVFAVVSLVLMNFVQLGESVPATQENLENKIKMFLESRCTSRNETLEQEEFVSRQKKVDQAVLSLSVFLIYSLPERKSFQEIFFLIFQYFMMDGI